MGNLQKELHLEAELDIDILLLLYFKRDSLYSPFSYFYFNYQLQNSLFKSNPFHPSLALLFFRFDYFALVLGISFLLLLVAKLAKLLMANSRSERTAPPTRLKTKGNGMEWGRGRRWFGMREWNTAFLRVFVIVNHRKSVPRLRCSLVFAFTVYQKLLCDFCFHGPFGPLASQEEER